MYKIIMILLSLSLLHANIFELIDNGDNKGVNNLLNDDRSILDSKSKDGLSPLLYSSAKGKLEIVKNLLERGADLHSKDREGSGILINGVASGNLDLVKFLLTQDLDLNFQDSNGMTPLHFAAMFKDPAIADLLLKNGAKIVKNRHGNSPLFSSIYYGNLETTKLVLQNGGDLNEKSSRGLSLIYPAIISKNIDLMKYLNDKGLDFKTIDSFGKNMVYYAFSRADIPTIKYLMDLGLEYQLEEDEEYTIIHAAMRGKKIENLKFAMEQNIVISDKAKLSLAHHLFNSDEDIFNLVYENIVLKDQKCYNQCVDEETPFIFWPVFTDKPQYLKRFIDDGIALDGVSSRSNRNILHEAIYHNKSDIIDVLMGSKVDLDNRDKFYNRSILHSAVLTGSKDIVEKIFKQYPEGVEKEDIYGYTPLDYSVKYGFNSITEYLNEREAKNSDIFQLENSKQIADNQLRITHTGHSGFIVSDDDIALIFDYWEDRRSVDNRSIKNGSLNIDDFEGKEIYVFSSHTHRDHYDKKIFQLGDKATYILGFKDPTLKQDYISMEGRSQRKFNNIKVTSVSSNDSGVGFLVEYKGTKIFHTGDHANRHRDLTGNYLPEIEYIKNSVGKVDILITPVSGCNFGDNIAVWKGNSAAVSALKPSLVLPAHSNNGSNEFIKFSSYIEREYPELSCIPLVNPGDYTTFSTKAKIQ